MPGVSDSRKSTERASLPCLSRSSSRIAPLNSPARSVAGAACRHERRRSTSSSVRRGKTKEASSRRAASSGGHRVIDKTPSSSAVQLATAASERQWHGGASHQHPRRLPLRPSRTSAVHDGSESRA
eukprot:2680665-Pleurochrysis_carterae.AAC.1